MGTAGAEATWILRFQNLDDEVERGQLGLQGDSRRNFPQEFLLETHMKKITKLSALFAAAAIAPAVVAPTSASAQAQNAAAQFQDVPAGHWAYNALNKLASAGIVEGYPPSGDYRGQRALTRYEFAVAIARLLDKIGPNGEPYNDTELRNRIAALETRPVPDITRAEVIDLIDQLRREFRDELARLGARVDSLEARVTAEENKVTPPPRLTISPSILHHTGYASYIDNTPNSPGQGGGRIFLNGAGGPVGTVNNGTGFVDSFATQSLAAGQGASFSDRVSLRKFSYTDFELRLTDRVSDRLSLNAAVRSLGANQEDPWAGDSNGGFYLREAYAVADISNRSFLGARGGSLTLGRQRTQMGLGLLYDNQLSPTDQLRAEFGIGPFAVNAFVGTQNNVSVLNGSNSSDPYSQQGALYYLNTGNTALDNAVGFAASQPGFGSPADDNESLVRADVNLFRISGRPVQLGYTRLLDGFRSEEGDSVDLTLPLFNRTIGVEYVRKFRNSNSIDPTAGGDEPEAIYGTLNVLNTSLLSLNVAAGTADEEFQYFAASSANPFARSYGQAIFDRPIALGAPLINGDGGAGEPQFLAAKRVFDVSGTLRLPLGFLRRVPLDFRYYTAKSGEIEGGGRRDLGKVYSVGTRFNLTPGVDLEVKGGVYEPDGNVREIRYVRVGASVGF